MESYAPLRWRGYIGVERVEFFVTRELGHFSIPITHGHKWSWLSKGIKISLLLGLSVLDWDGVTLGGGCWPHFETPGSQSRSISEIWTRSPLPKRGKKECSWFSWLLVTDVPCCGGCSRGGRWQGFSSLGGGGKWLQSTSWFWKLMHWNHWGSWKTIQLPDSNRTIGEIKWGCIMKRRLREDLIWKNFSDNNANNNDEAHTVYRPLGKALGMEKLRSNWLRSWFINSRNKTQMQLSSDLVHSFLSFFLRFYLFQRERERERITEGEGETDSPLSREPNAGLNPRTLKSWPESKADA